MGVFKRICLLVFGLAGLLSLVALALPWWGPWTEEARALLGVYWYYATLECLICVTAFGLLICLARALFTRNRKVIVVAKVRGGTITITRDAIAAQVVHMIEEGRDFRARRVRVRAKRHGHVRVACRVQPLHAIRVVSEGKTLHDRIVAGLKDVCGDHVDRVQVEFIDAGTDGSPLEDDGIEAGGASVVEGVAEESVKDRGADITPPSTLWDGAVIEMTRTGDGAEVDVPSNAAREEGVDPRAIDDSSEIRLPMPRQPRDGDGRTVDPDDRDAAAGTGGGSRVREEE